MGNSNFGLTEQILTLLPDKNLATEFFSDEVDTYLAGLGGLCDTIRFIWSAFRHLSR